MIKKLIILLIIFSGLLFHACIYKAGNRLPDLNYDIHVSINTFYVEKYLKETWGKRKYDSPLNSELANFPERFIPLTDSLVGLKYVIEDSVSPDSLNNTGWGLKLSSVYNLKNEKWIIARDSLKSDELSRFSRFFTDSILYPTIKKYENVNNLFLNKSRETKIIEIN